MADVEINLETTNPQELIGLGLRAYAIGDFSNAAAAFGRATQLLAQEHGDEHDSLGEVYLNYAKALLEVSREESEPLGDAIPHGESDSDSEEADGENGTSTSADIKEESADDKDEPAEDKVESAEKIEEPVENKEESAEKSEEEKGDKSEKKVDGEVAQNGDTNKIETKDDDESKVNESGDAQVDEENQKAEDCTDLQLAWEVLEVAKKIFTNRGDNGKTLLSETLILLGEVAMESENFVDGVNDIKAGLEIQKTIFESTSRKLAETYYKLGMALATISSIEEAIKNFELSIETLKKRIQMLDESMEDKKKDDKTGEKSQENMTDDKKDEKKDEKSRAIKRTKTEDEINEMKALIPEITEKINDTKSIKEEMAAKLILEITNSTQKKEDGASSSKTAKDISHLVKRKRKDEDEVTESGDINPSKKPSP